MNNPARSTASVKPAGTAVAGTHRLLVPLLIGMAVVAFNLRASVTSVGPVLPELRHDLDLSSTLASLLTALPLICFAAFSPTAPSLIRRFRIEPLIAGALAILIAALALRVTGSVAALLGGTAVVGAALALINVSLPVLIQRDDP